MKEVIRSLQAFYSPAHADLKARFCGSYCCCCYLLQILEQIVCPATKHTREFIAVMIRLRKDALHQVPGTLAVFILPISSLESFFVIWQCRRWFSFSLPLLQMSTKFDPTGSDENCVSTTC